MSRSTLHTTERERLEHQVVLDSCKSALARNRLGQFATPPQLANEIATLMMSMWPEGRPIRFLDPGVGTGAFYSALRRIARRRQIKHAVGVELDPEVAKVTRSLWGEDGLEVLNADFTQLVPPVAARRATMIIANPPYVRHHHLGAETKRRLGARIASELGLTVSGLAGLYCHFLLLSHAWMAEGSLAAWLVPAECFDVNYGRVLRQYLSGRVTLLRIHRFDPADVQFADALVSSVVVVFRNEPPSAQHAVVASMGGSLLAPSTEAEFPASQLARAPKWTPLLKGRAAAPIGRPRLSDFFKIKRGIATGANKFFIMSKSKSDALGFPAEVLRPILPSPRALTEPIISSDPSGYPALPDPLVLIDTTLPLSDIELRWPSLSTYLQEGQRAGIASGFLLSRRAPWYSQEKRPPAPFVCTYMGRGRNGVSPFRFYWNLSLATAPNVFLMLYPVGVLKSAMEADANLAAKVFGFLQSIDAECFKDGGREYGGALRKVEPGELAAFDATELAKLLAEFPSGQSQLSLFETYAQDLNEPVATSQGAD